MTSLFHSVSILQEFVKEVKTELFDKVSPKAEGQVSECIHLYMKTMFRPQITAPVYQDVWFLLNVI